MSMGTVHAAFEAVAAAHPTSAAVVDAAGTLSYAELDRRANRLAQRLRAFHAGPESLVGVCVEPSADLIVALLGTLKAGAACLPLDPAYPAERVAFMLADAGASIIVHDGSGPAGVPSGTDRVRLDQLDHGEDTDDCAAVETGVRAANLAYTIYTSGSTGRPKGVCVEHRNVLQVLEWSREAMGLGPSTRTLQTLTYSFDFGLYELLVTLLSGATLHFSPTGTRDLHEFVDYASANRITALHITPTLLAELAKLGRPLGQLELVLVGGEKFPRQLAKAARAILPPGCRLMNGYGPTENSVHSSAFDLATEQAPIGEEVPIGSVTAGTRAYVLDRDMQLVPIGVPGELYVGGPGVARGYLGRAGLTAERFLPDPFAAEPGARLYRTGDIVRWRPDGRLVHLRRTDDQVKVRGHRIELGEIEAALREHPRVGEAVAMVRHDADDPVLVGYVLPEGEAPSGAQLREFLTRRLPTSMIPTAFATIDALPLSPSGKLDRMALPPPEGMPTSGAGATPPRDVYEFRVAQLLEEALGVDRVGAQDDFFELGGHSLLALRLVARIKEDFGRDLPMATILTAATVEGIAAALRGPQVAEAGFVVPLRATGSGPTVVLPHAVGGEIFCYFELARALPADWRLFALRSPVLDGAEARDDIVSMASDYLELLSSSLDAAPDALVGWSMGGLLAYEMARQLQQQTGASPLALMIDSIPAQESELRREFSQTDLAATVVQEMAAAQALAPASGENAEEVLHAGLGTLAAALGRDTPEEQSRLLAMYRAHMRAANRYLPQPLAGDAALITGSRSGSIAMGVVSRWRQVVQGDLAVSTVPGDHHSLLAGENAAGLARAIERAVAAGSRAPIA